MLYFDLLTLGMAWLLFKASEIFFPVLHTALSVEADWVTYLFFKPIHLLLSSLCFICVFLLIRRITMKYIHQIFRKGKLVKVNRMTAIAMILLGWWMAAIVILKYWIPSAMIIGILLLFDMGNQISALRRNRRLKTSIRQLQQ